MTNYDRDESEDAMRDRIQREKQQIEKIRQVSKALESEIELLGLNYVLAKIIVGANPNYTSELQARYRRENQGIN